MRADERQAPRISGGRRCPARPIVASLAVAVCAMLSLTTFSAPAIAAPKTTKKPTAKPAAPPKASVAGFCAASKAWKAYEVGWFATGKANEAWVRDTQVVMRKLVATAPKAIRSQMLFLAVEILRQRGQAVNFGKNPGDAQSLDELIVDAGIDAGQVPSSFLGARDAVGAYAIKNCKVDVLQPFRDFAAANG